MAPTGWREVGGLHTEGKKSRIRGVGDVAPYGFSYIFKQTTAILLCVILSEATKARFSSQTRYRRSRFAVNGESKDLDRAKNARARCEHAELFVAKRYFVCVELQRFYLDPARRLRLAVCLFVPCGTQLANFDFTSFRSG